MNICKMLDSYVKYFLRFATLGFKIAVIFYSWMITNFVITLVVLNVES